MTTPKRWQEIDRIFAAALEREPARRAAFLDEACAGDELLRREVESLLAHDTPESLVGGYAVQEATRLLQKSAAENPVERIGRYQIIRSLGVGGMGRVYLGHDEQLNRPVAVKLLSNYDASEEERMRRFRQEALAASALNHPNILTIYEIGEFEDTNFITAEFVDGMTLRARMKAGPLPLDLALDIAIQTTSALSAAHAAGIIHRDIKPENVMVRVDGLVKVLDFGIAKFTQAEGHEKKELVETMPGRIIGTAAYMSPEQARGALIDRRSDIWSVGVILYELVAGRLPFWGDTPADVIGAVLKQQPPPCSLHKSIAPELERIIFKALEKDREKRHQTAAELLIDLKQLKHTLEVEPKIECTAPPESRSREGDSKSTADREAVSTLPRPAHAATAGPRKNSSADLISETNPHQRGRLLALAAIVAVTTAGVVYLAYSRYAGEDSAGTIRSIAVLPFANTGGNPDTEYLSDGISEALINSLSQLPGVKVIARSSSFRYRGKEVAPDQVANELGVEAILTGRVLQRGDNLLISVELVNARDKTQVWGEQYNRKATDVLQVQSEISREIADKLRLRLTANTRQQLAKSETTNPQAYELLLQALFYRNKGGSENNKKAIEYLKQATAVDPAYATAYAQLSESYRSQVVQGVLDPKDATPQAKAAAGKALELDENLADAHFAQAGLELDGWDWATAEGKYKRAIELNPNLAKAHGGYSQYLSVMGRHEQAIAEIKRTVEMDPLSPLGKAAVGERLRHARQYDQAIEALRNALERNQNFPNIHRSLGRVYAAKGQYAEAIAAYQEAIRLGQDNSIMEIYLGAAYALGGERKRAQAILMRLETSNQYVSPAKLAVLYAALGEPDQAFASLEKAYAARDLQMQFLGVDPDYDSLRSDPRFQELLRRIGWPQ